MALLITRTLYNTDVVTYHRITHVIISKDPLVGKVRVESFKDKQDRYRHESSDYYKWYPVVWDGNLNYMGDAYNNLKTLPEFEGALDV